MLAADMSLGSDSATMLAQLPGLATHGLSNQQALDVINCVKRNKIPWRQVLGCFPQVKDDMTEGKFITFFTGE